MTEPEKPPIIPYADKDTRRRRRWWNLVGGLIVVAYISAVAACFWFADPKDAGGGVCLCTYGFVGATICWAGLRFGTQEKDYWA